jgi:hypothetical protein
MFFFQNIYQGFSICFDPAIDKTTLTCQNAFIQGNNIIDGVMSLHDILHEFRSKKTRVGV